MRIHISYKALSIRLELTLSIHLNMLRRDYQAESTNGLVEVQDMDPYQDDDFDLNEAIPSLADSEVSSTCKVILSPDVHSEQRDELMEVVNEFRCSMRRPRENEHSRVPH